MIVTQRELEAALNPKIRLRVVHLPLQYGRFGERKRCPVRPNQVVTMKSRCPYEQYKQEAEAMPNGQLWLYDRIQAAPRSMVVTVRDVGLLCGRQNDDDTWRITFSKGDQSSTLDEPRLLSARPGREGDVEGDYTTVPSRSVKGSGEEVAKSVHKMFAEEAKQNHSLTEGSAREGLLRAVEATAKGPRARKRIKSIEHHLKLLDAEASNPLDRAVYSR